MKRWLSSLVALLIASASTPAFASGESVLVPAPYAVTRGSPVVVGVLTGIASGPAAEGASVRVWREGVFTVAKATGEAWAIGDALYFSEGDSGLSKTSATRTFFGVAGAVASSGATTGSVILVPLRPAVPDLNSVYYGPGSDGDLVCTASNITSGPLVNGVLVRDAYWRNVTIGAGCVITVGSASTAVFPIFVSGSLDLSAAEASSIRAWKPTAGGNGASSGTAGTAAAVEPATTRLPAVSSGIAGSAGQTGAGSSPSTQGATLVVGGTAFAAGGNGGAGTAAAGTGGAYTPIKAQIDIPPISGLLTGFASVRPSPPGRPGAGGGGDNGSNHGGGGGASGQAGPAIWLFAQSILRGAGTAAGVFYSEGANGGNGGAGQGANAGGGGGGGAGGGGAVFVTEGGLLGAAKSNVFNLPGGTGGGGGASGGGTGNAGSDGSGGPGGIVVHCSTVTMSCTTTAPTVAPSGTTGGNTAVTL